MLDSVNKTSSLKLRVQEKKGFQIYEKDFCLRLYISMEALWIHTASYLLLYFRICYNKKFKTYENWAFSLKPKLYITRLSWKHINKSLAIYQVLSFLYNSPSLLNIYFFISFIHLFYLFIIHLFYLIKRFISISSAFISAAFPGAQN